MNPDQLNFLIAEYNALHQEIYALLETQRALPEYALLASAGVWSWLLSRGRPPVSKWVGLVPLFLSVILALRTGCIALQARFIGNYLSYLEQALALPSPFGWESRLKNSNYPAYVVAIEYSLWILLVIGNAIGARYYVKHYAENADGARKVVDEHSK